MHSGFKLKDHFDVLQVGGQVLMITTQYTLRLMSDAASETQLPASKYGNRGSETESARTFFKTILAISRQVLENFGLPNVLIL